jgi:hypothetical protein
MPPPRLLPSCATSLEIVVGEESAVVVALQPVVEMDLIQVGPNQFLPEFARLAAQEGNLQPGRRGDERLGNAIRTTADTGLKDFSSLNAAVITSSRCGQRLIQRSRLTNTVRSVVNE